MELLVADLKDVKIARNTFSPGFIAIKHWSVLLMDESDSEVIDIRLRMDKAVYSQGCSKKPRSIKDGCFRCGGSLDFRFVPPTVRRLEVNHMLISGTVDTTTLPSVPESLEIPINSFRGSLSIEGLPLSMTCVDVQSNKLEGSLHLELLPPAMEVFHADGNNFSGTVNLSALPSKLRTLSLEENNLSGKIELRNIPKPLGFVALHDNAFDRSAAVVDGDHTFTALRLPYMLRKRVFDDNGALTDERIKGLSYNKFHK